MALTPRIVTRHTRLFGVLLFLAVVGAVWTVAELAPQRVVPEELDAVPSPVLDHEPAPYRVPEHLAFQPSEDRGEDRLCRWTADQVWLHFDQLAEPAKVEVHTREVAELMEAYIDLGCPARVHRGDWHVNAEVLGVGLVHETLQPQAEILEPAVQFDSRADQLIPAATNTFEVLAPTRMCKQAVRHHQEMYRECMDAFGR